MYYKIYKPLASGIRFKRRLYWSGKFKIKRLSRPISPRFRFANSGQQLMKSRGRGIQKKCWIINWYQLYDLVILKCFFQYSKQNSSGLLLTKFLNNSFMYCPFTNKTSKSNKLLFIKDIKLGSKISNIELYPGKGIQLIRAAGASGKLFNFATNGYKLLKLPSRKLIAINGLCRGMIGHSYNVLHRKINYSKAGTAKKLGFRLHVRGTAMNATDHPHGGKSGPSRTSVSPWGWVTK